MRADTERERCVEFARVYLKRERDDWARGRRGRIKNAIRDAVTRTFSDRPCALRVHFSYRVRETLTGQALVVVVPGFEPQRAHHCFVV